MYEENVFGEFLKKGEAFLAYKNIVLKKPQNLLFTKGSDHGFCKKLTTFSIFTFNAKWINKKCLVKFLKKRKPF